MSIEMSAMPAVGVAAQSRATWDPVYAGLGFAELIVGLVALGAADYYPVFDSLAGLGGVGGIFILSYCVLRPETVKVYDLLSATLLLAYGTGTLNSVVSFALGHQELIRQSVLPQYWFTRTLSLVLCVCGSLHLVGRIDNDGYVLRRAPSTPAEANRVLTFMTPLFLLYCGLLATGRIGYMAAVSETGGPEVSPIAVMTLLLSAPSGALALAAGLVIPRGKTRVLLIGIALAILLFNFGLGRRSFLISLLMFIMCSLFVRRPKRLINVKNVTLLTVAILSLYVVTTGFYAMRMATWALSRGGVTHFSVFELIPKAYEIYSNDRGGNLQANIAKNVKTRTFVLEYLTQISKGEALREPLYGDDLYRAVVVAIPSVLYPEKYQDKYFTSEEPLINPAFGLPVIDGPNSILTAGVSDFGIFGLFLYPIALCFGISLMLRCVYRFGPPAIGLFFGMYICRVLLAAETDVSAYISSFRVMIPTTAVLWFYFGWKKRVPPRSSV